MTDAPAPKRRGWIDALIATALRWNERLGRPVGEDEDDRAAKAATLTGGRQCSQVRARPRDADGDPRSAIHAASPRGPST